MAVDWLGAWAGFLHLGFAVAWVGGLGWTLAADEATRGARLRLFEGVAWLSAALLSATGVVLMVRDANYPGGLGNWTNLWSRLLVVKHALVLGMLGLLAASTFSLRPRLRREPDSVALRRAQRALLGASLVLGVVVLGLTAVILAIPPPP